MSDLVKTGVQIEVDAKSTVAATASFILTPSISKSVLESNCSYSTSPAMPGARGFSEYSFETVSTDILCDGTSLHTATRDQLSVDKQRYTEQDYNSCPGLLAGGVLLCTHLQ